MEQLDLFATELTEAWVYSILLESLQAVIQKNNASAEKLSLVEGKSYSSVWYDTQMAFRICCRNDRHYFGVSNTRASLANEAILHMILKTSANDGFTNFRFEPSPDGVQIFSDFLSSVLDAAIDSLPKEFDCCSRYEQCSDARTCIHPKPEMAMACGYRKILKQGRIFYGKNKNI